MTVSLVSAMPNRRYQSTNNKARNEERRRRNPSSSDDNVEVDAKVADERARIPVFGTTEFNSFNRSDFASFPQPPAVRPGFRRSCSPSSSSSPAVDRSAHIRLPATPTPKRIRLSDDARTPSPKGFAFSGWARERTTLEFVEKPQYRSNKTISKN